MSSLISLELVSHQQELSHRGFIASPGLLFQPLKFSELKEFTKNESQFVVKVFLLLPEVLRNIHSNMYVF